MAQEAQQPLQRLALGRLKGYTKTVLCSYCCRISCCWYSWCFSKFWNLKEQGKLFAFYINQYWFWQVNLTASVSQSVSHSVSVFSQSVINSVSQSVSRSLIQGLFTWAWLTGLAGLPGRISPCVHMRNFSPVSENCTVQLNGMFMMWKIQ